MSVDEGTYTLATPNTAGDWSSGWYITVNIKEPGRHVITAKGTDNTGNQNTDSVSIEYTITQTESRIDNSGSDDNNKIFLAEFLPYVNTDTQVNIYQTLDSDDYVKLRSRDGGLDAAKMQAVHSLPGHHGIEYISSRQVIDNAQRIAELGFDFIELNIEPGFSPEQDYRNVVWAYERAAQAAHDAGLKFRATPTRADTTIHGIEIAPHVDYFHVQAQSLQDNNTPRDYSGYVHDIVPKLKAANPGLQVTV